MYSGLRNGMALKIRLVAKQPEAVLDLPDDLQLAARRLGGGLAFEPGAGEEGGAGRNGKGAHIYPNTNGAL